MLIGISGHMRAGKDAVAEYLCAHHHFVRIGFADALKREVARTLRRTLAEYVRTHYGITEAQAIGDKVSELLYVDRDSVTRALLQEWGTELRRTEDPQYWVRKWQTAYLDSGAQRVVCADVRFPNEARAIVSCGGMLWLVRRPGAAGNGHESEAFCETFHGWNAVLENDGTLADLYAAIERTLTISPSAMRQREH